MKRFYKSALFLQLSCLIYAIVHNYYFMSQYVMFVAGILSLALSVFIFWQCFTNTEIKRGEKYIGLAIAVMPFLCILGIVFVFILFSRGMHC
jgi:hypothetical protein